MVTDWYYAEVRVDMKIEWELICVACTADQILGGDLLLDDWRDWPSGAAKSLPNGSYTKMKCSRNS